MGIDTMDDKYKKTIEDLTLALMYLTRFNDSEGKPFFELSWKGYDHGALDRLNEDDYISDPGRAKYAYILPKGYERAKQVVKDFGLTDRGLYERFEFRTILEDEAEQAAQVEEKCFPAGEACTLTHMEERIAAAKDIFLVAVDKESGRIAGFVNGIATDEMDFRDEFFTDASLHDPDGKNIMICGVCVLPYFRKQGLARELVYEYCRREWERGRKRLILTCKQEKVKMYKKFGFRDLGESASSWGGKKWNLMETELNY